MMSPVIIDPEKIKHFGDETSKCFAFVTDNDLIDMFEILDNGRYPEIKKLSVSKETDINHLIEEDIPEYSHILVVCPNTFLTSPDYECLKNKKMIVIPCASTPTKLDDIKGLLATIEKTDPVEEESDVETFFSIGRESTELSFVNNKYSTKATFKHLSDGYEWNVQAGRIGWGEQQIAPSGEISVTPKSIMEFDSESTLDINGELTIGGPVIMHCGTPLYLEDDRTRIHNCMNIFNDSPIIVTVENGKVVHIRETDERGKQGVEMLRTLIAIDSRYAILWECGFGINKHHVLRDGNIGMNETHGSNKGVSHWGLGLTPYTQYAFIFLCLDTSVIGSDDKYLVRSKNDQAMMNKSKSGQCPCYPS